MIVLGIESSCDETAASVVKDGRTVLSSVVASQIDVHHIYGGVVPELASRKHIEAIVPVVTQAVEKAGLSFSEVDALAVTQGPGLIGSLLVGFSFAKSLAYGLDIPWIGVSHLTGHINSVFLEPDPPTFPFVALLASGGHTSVYFVRSHTDMELMGQTRDDAAGEAFDKVAKMLALGYPGGKVISDLAAAGNASKIKFPRAFIGEAHYDFSFSGLKTAVSRYLQTHPDTYRDEMADIAASFQEAVVDVLTVKLIGAAVARGCKGMALVGGVAANQRLRAAIRAGAKKRGLTVWIPALDLCGDNAAMIAATGYHYLKTGKQSHFNEDVYSREIFKISVQSAAYKS
jgi:N6-L-threonylcarbamoyladenine synthase